MPKLVGIHAFELRSIIILLRQVDPLLLKCKCNVQENSVFCFFFSTSIQNPTYQEHILLSFIVFLSRFYKTKITKLPRTTLHILYIIFWCLIKVCIEIFTGAPISQPARNESDTLTMSSKGPQTLSDQELYSSTPLPSQPHDEDSAATEDWPEDALKMLVIVKEHENIRDMHIDPEGFAGLRGPNLGHQAVHQLAIVLPRL